MKDKSNLSDKKLVLEYQSGNKKVIAVLVKRWHIQFCKLAFYYVNDADISKDIAQESWQIILNKLDTLKNPKQFKSWAISIVNRKSIDYLRANKRILKKYQKYHAEKQNNFISDEIDEDEKLKNDLLKAIQKLSIEQFNDISIATYGIFTFKNFKDRTKQKTENQIIEDLLIDSTYSKFNNLLDRKIKILKETENHIVTDDLAIIRLINL